MRIAIGCVLALSAGTAGAAPLTADECVAVALAKSAKIEEAAAKVREYEARLAEVESVYYPKLQAVAYVAPMFTLSGDATHFERRYKSSKDWGPYTHLQALLAQPLYTFGRAEAGEVAAAERVEVERARVREVELAVALEVRKLYYGRLLALSMLPALDAAAATVREALERGEERYDAGTGEVSQADLMKLTYGRSEIAKGQLEAQYGATLAAAALKQAMGLADDQPLALADDRLPDLPGEEPLSVPALVAESARRRPEWRQIQHGRRAVESLALAELRANYPVLFAAGQLTYDWTPMRQDSPNPYVYDAYNQLVGGVAIGLLFNLDPALAAAKARGAEALAAEIDALDRFAATGIPLRVRKAAGDLQRARRLAELSADGVKATKKWMAFAATQYLTGLGDARDLLEGLVAYLSAKKAAYQASYEYFVSRAALDFAVGH
ncbi:MAG: TolC family protein [Deltaproteobacteria bacterium]|nr:TolC family protein [Deltaproteobacteria bacterium]